MFAFQQTLHIDFFIRTSAVCLKKSVERFEFNEYRIKHDAPPSRYLEIYFFKFSLLLYSFIPGLGVSYIRLVKCQTAMSEKRGKAKTLYVVQCMYC